MSPLSLALISGTRFE